MKRSSLTFGAFCLAVLCTAHGASLAAAPSRVSSKLTVSPSTCPFGGTYVVSGSGFKADSMVVVTLERRCDDGITYTGMIWANQADAGGSISLTRETEVCTGTYVIRAEQQGAHGRRAGASVSFIVY